MNIYDFDNYKKFVLNWIEGQPKKGRGLAVRISEKLGISTVLFSQIFRGEKNLSMEHALLFAETIPLLSEERDYFLLLVQFERSGTQKLKNHFKAKIKEIQDRKNRVLKEIIETDIQLTETDKAIFYSSWLYSAIRLLCSIEGFQNIEAISKKLEISQGEVAEKMKFLIEKRLCVLTKKGYEMGPQRTHLGSDSPFIQPRQISWRLKGFEIMNLRSKDHLFYTAPMSISQEHYQELRKKMTQVISELNQMIPQKKPEKLAVLNIDLFSFEKE